MSIVSEKNYRKRVTGELFFEDAEREYPTRSIGYSLFLYEAMVLDQIRF